MMKRWFISLLISLMMSPIWANDSKTPPSEAASVRDPNTLTVMAWNIWGRKNLNPMYTFDDVTARQRVIHLLQDSEADIICMIETYGSAAEIAKALDYHYYTPSADANLTIFSRYPLSDMGTASGLSSFSFIHATVTLPDGRKVRVHNIWLTSAGLHIQTILDAKTSDEALTTADNIRKRMIDGFIKDPGFKADIAQADQVPVIVAGDFNWVSHLDYNEATKAAGLNDGRILPIPTSRAMAEIDFVDTYRACNPLTSKKALGYTWSTVGIDWTWKSGKGFVPSTGEKGEEYLGLYGRIDYIYSRGAMLTPKSSEVIATYRTDAVSNFPHFPSDHAAVVTRFKLNPVATQSTLPKEVE